MLENRIYLYIKIIPIIFIFISTFWISYIQINNIKIEVEQNIQNEIDSIFINEKEYLKQNVSVILDYIRHQKAQTLKIAQTRIKDKTMLALNIAKNIYNTQKNIYPQETIKKNIIDALRDIKYKINDTNSYTYYFIQEYYDDNNIIAKLLPTTPQFENQNRAFVHDANGKHHILDFYKACSNGVGDFVTYYWKKVNNDDKAYPKLSYIAYFEPFNWMIGYGEYLDEIEKDIKKDTLNWITDIQHRKNYDYYVAELLDIKGGKNFAKILFNPQNQVENENDFLSDDYKDFNNIEYRKIYLEDLRKNKESFIEYKIKNPNTGQYSDKLLYMSLDTDWNWIISQGIFLDEFYKKIEDLKKSKDKKIHEIIVNGLVIGFILAFIISIIIYLISEKLRNMLNNYKHRELENSKLLANQTKMVALTEVIENIAHQWRQPLSVISTLASGTKTQIEFELIDKADVEKNLSVIVEQSQFLSKTIDNFRNFGSSNQEKDEIYFSEILDKSISLVEPILNDDNIKIIKDYELDSKIFGNKNELIQSFFNILNNSKDIFIEKNIPKENRYIFVHTQKKDNLFKIIITDTAGGISQENKAKIFEPYFTTKHKSLGKGLSLALTYRIIVEHHNGKIEVINEESKYENKKLLGASFIFIFEINKN